MKGSANQNLLHAQSILSLVLVKYQRFRKQKYYFPHHIFITFLCLQYEESCLSVYKIERILEYVPGPSRVTPELYLNS